MTVLLCPAAVAGPAAGRATHQLPALGPRRPPAGTGPVSMPLSVLTPVTGARHPARRRMAIGLVALVVAVAALLGTGLTGSSAGDLQAQIASARSAAAALRAQVAADSAQIAATGTGLARAHQQLVGLQARLQARETELVEVQRSLLAARDHLVALENRLHLATVALSDNLVAGYEGQPPSLITVILSSHGFNQLLDQMGFLRRIAHQNASVVSFTRVARAEVAQEARRLAALERRDQTLADEILAQRNQVAALQAALLRRQMDEITARSDVRAHVAGVDARIGSLQAKLNAIEAAAAAAAARAAQTGNAQVGGIAVDTGGMVQAPAGAPAAVAQVIAAGNAIATLPYIWGGGHGSFHADGYDCSGSVSYALAAAGLVSSPMVSGDFENWGDPGPGRWITVYANADNVWMQVAGWRFDTVALSAGGTRWAQGGGEYSGFVVRHPPGL
jgi:cell wall-associated NlpC family hydrolase